MPSKKAKVTVKQEPADKPRARRAASPAGGDVKRVRPNAPPQAAVPVVEGDGVQAGADAEVVRHGDVEHEEASRKYHDAQAFLDIYDTIWTDYQQAYNTAAAELNLFQLQHAVPKADYFEEYELIKKRGKLLRAVIKAAEKYAAKENEYAKAYKLVELRGHPWRQNFPKDQRRRRTFRLRPGQVDPRKNRQVDEDARSEITYDSDYTVVLEQESQAY